MLAVARAEAEPARAAPANYLHRRNFQRTVLCYIPVPERRLIRQA